jgi:hypothetical protein
VQPQSDTPARPARPAGRGLLIAAGAAGLVLLVGATAGAVVLLGSPSSSASDEAAVRAVPSPSALPATASATPSATPGDSPDPTPSSTVTGKVKSGGIHTGDLRYFLLRPPADAEVYGDEDGTELTRSEVANDVASVKSALGTYGFRTGVSRTYLTADGGTQITAKLARFSSPANATAYYSRLYFGGTRITLGGSHPAKAYRLSSSSAESTGSVIVVSHQGDVHITLSVTGAKTPGTGQLRRLLDQQYERLATGR